MPRIHRAALPAIAALLLAGCASTRPAADVTWVERCAATGGHTYCFDVPAPRDGDKPGVAFERVDAAPTTRHIYAPWQTWSGWRWDALVATVDAGPPVSTEDDAALIAWAGIRDAAANRQAIAAGQPSGSLPAAYRVAIHVDANGRRWVRGERKWAEGKLPYVRKELEYVTPVDGGRVRLRLSFSCSSPNPNCSYVERMVDGVRWTD